MNRTLKYILSRTYQPVVSRYLRKTRIFRYGDLRLTIPKGVFHPGFFRSTKILLKYLEGLPLAGKRFLELGAGNGLISLAAAKRGAIVTATDINANAVNSLQENSRANQLPIEIIHSDLFADIPHQRFDIVAINPPYYKKDPESPEEHAWYCGTEGQYFQKLFEQIGAYLHSESIVLMILSEECDLEMIRRIATEHEYNLTKVLEKKVLSERLYIFRIVGPQTLPDGKVN